MKPRRQTSAETSARFRAMFERRAAKLDEETGRRRQLDAIVAACRRAGRPIPRWVQIALFAQQGSR